MTVSRIESASFCAPAKINLYLHVTGRRPDGYHSLDSLVAFADTGDLLTLEPAKDFSFSIEGPFAGMFRGGENGGDLHSSNLVVRAVRAMAEIARQTPRFRVVLTKNLPLASGLGGGSADAAAVLRALCDLWDLPMDDPRLLPLMMGLGTDVPVCLNSVPARLRGAGEILEDAPALPPLPAVLIHPDIPCPTSAVFARYAGPFSQSPSLPETFGSPEDLIAFLKDRDNDLYPAAAALVPEITQALESLSAFETCLLARMAGSGSSCFGLFSTEEAARNASGILAARHPGWWVKSCVLNLPSRSRHLLSPSGPLELRQGETS
ncbi:MAG: 4-(cytidine 5'-diphospho)-2-C-methyl-D-erythritol kinase [Alphaproteobacteria bacterium]|nr:4-(cytidine 5'-diphospho)-2-C-methyl-D-erythritol kinase [Alphaproteobacteria bacterium]